MSKLRIAYLASFVILGVLVVLALSGPLTSIEKVSTICRESAIKDKENNRWIIQFNILNKEGKDTSYLIIWSSGEYTYSESVSLKDGRMFTYIHYVYPETVKEGKVNLEIYKEGESTPFEQITYPVRFD